MEIHFNFALILYTLMTKSGSIERFGKVVVLENERSFHLGEYTGSTKVQENSEYQEKPWSSDLWVLYVKNLKCRISFRKGFILGS